MVSNVFGQAIPINSDYLSDNIYLIHPAGAGVGNTGKIRFTAKKQWMDVKGAPSFQTLSFHNRFNKKSAIGLILTNDQNGYFSKKRHANCICLPFGYEFSIKGISVNYLLRFLQAFIKIKLIKMILVIDHRILLYRYLRVAIILM